jgi:DNA-directed RNA polymerase specialized sigma24 family protein
MRAIVNLSPDDRNVVLLSLWESCPQGAIAEALDLSVGAVRSVLGRIRRELKIAVQTDAGNAS